MMDAMSTDAPIEAAARNHAAFIWSVADFQAARKDFYRRKVDAQLRQDGA